MAFTGPLADRVEIRELIEVYADAVMRGDAEEWGTVWAEDAFWSLPEFPGLEAFHGREAIVAGWVRSMADFGKAREEGGKPVMIYIATPGAINVDGDRATARVYTSEIFTVPGTDKEIRTRGQYDDELARIDGKWLFTKRIYRVLHSE